MSSTAVDNPDIARIISYWFDADMPQKKWFEGGVEVDEEIREKFGGLMEKAHDSKLDSWTQKPKGTLALLLLLDQFSRNAYRRTPRMYASDAKALDVATTALAKKQDAEVTFMQRVFFTLPLMHDEKLMSQIACIAILKGYAVECAPGSKEREDLLNFVEYGERHLHCILNFGRCPSRNVILGRNSTPEEIEHLKEFPRGF